MNRAIRARPVLLHGSARRVVPTDVDTDQNKLTVARFDELGNVGGDPSVLDELCMPDLVNHALAPGRPPGLEGTREFLRTARRDVFGGRWVRSHVVAENDMVVQFGSRELSWPGGSLMGFDTPAGTATRDVAFAYRLVSGRIAERWAIRDDLAMLLQLGGLRR
jgi:predicted ester cyclase